MLLLSLNIRNRPRVLVDVDALPQLRVFLQFLSRKEEDQEKAEKGRSGSSRKYSSRGHAKQNLMRSMEVNDQLKTTG